jgi:ATP-binding cassette subfamily B protein
MENNLNQSQNKKTSSIFNLLKPYIRQIIFLAILSIVASGLGLVIPKLISQSIDSYLQHSLIMKTLMFEFGAVILGIFIFTYLQSIVQTFASERVARDLRNTIALKISKQSYEFVERVTPARLLTNFTSDIDSIKMFVGQAIASLISAIVIIIGAAVLLMTIDWRLALAVLGIIPIIAILFFFIFSKVRILMKKSREVIDWLNKVINESVLGATLIRVLNSQSPEFNKFTQANIEAKGVGLKILNMFAALIPIIGFVANLGMLIVLVLGGHFVITGNMSLGDFAAFNSYIALLIFPVLMIGIMSSMISRAQASYDRIREVLDAKEEDEVGKINTEIRGAIEFKNVGVKYGGKNALKNVSFEIQPHTKTAIIGPTAAGKTQILHLLTRLISPTIGTILIDNESISEYDAPSLHRQIGFVFQDSIIFNLTLRENIAFGGIVNDNDLEKAIKTSELSDFIATLPEGLDTVISERGSSLSGGQKQRIMLARALALNPKILLLDDFTARVDNKTEKKILANLAKNYSNLTLVSVTQKISSIEHYDKIILLMEGEVIASGTHKKLLATSLEYVQIYDSQKSTSNYE